MRVKALTAGLVALVLMLGTVARASAQPTSKAKAKTPPAAATATALPGATKIATWLLEKAGGVAATKGAGFLMTALGLNSLFPSDTYKQLQDLQNQIAG